MNNGVKLSDWIVIDGYCATRVIDGSDPDLVSNRVAFIEKTPRVRTEKYTTCEEEQGKWEQGPKGRGGCLEEEGETIYGFYKPSRIWCESRLLEMGYDVPNMSLIVE